MTKLYIDDKKLWIPLELWDQAKKDRVSTNLHQVIVAAQEAIVRGDAVVIYRNTSTDSSVVLRCDNMPEFEDAIND
jgi:hypothetical protein